MLVIKRKNLVIGLLVTLLIITGYLNFVYNQSSISASHQDEYGSKQDREDSEITVRDSEPTGYSKDLDTDNSAVETSGSSFFRDYRFEREQTRASEVEHIKSIVENPRSEDALVNEAQQQLLELTGNMEKEMAIETLIKAKDFEDVVVIIHKNNVSVIVDKAELQAEEVAQILDIVMRESGESPDNIKIIPKM